MSNTDKLLMDSPYTFLEEIPLQFNKKPLFEADLHKLFRDNSYGKVEYLILEALSIYHYLNSFNLSRYLNSKLKEKKWPDYSHVIKKLCADNVINKVRYADHVFYCLYPYTHSYMAGKSKKGYAERYMPAETKTGILECASLAQWHIALTKGLNVKSNYFYKNIKFAGEIISTPSYIETTIGYFHYRILSLPFPKAGNDITSFFHYLQNTWRVFQKATGKRQITLTVFVISSLKEIKAISLLLESLEETKDRTVYYALEANCTEFTGLSCLYYYDKEHDSSTDAIKILSINNHIERKNL